MPAGFLYAQYKPNADTSANIILEKEFSGGIKFHTQGWGIKLLMGKNKTAFKRNTWQVEIVGLKSLKEIKVINPYYYGSNYYIFGKLNSIFLLTTSRGRYNQLNRKPYWGGVELRHFYHYGLNLSFAKPIYYHIVDPASGYYITDQYDRSKYSDTDIVRKASFFEGAGETKIFPGIHLETGLDFEYAVYKNNISSLAFGATFDFFPMPIPILAENDPEYFFFTLFLNFNLGRRHY